MNTGLQLVKYNFYSTVICDLLRAVENGSFGGGFVLAFCGIDYLTLPMAYKVGKNVATRTEYKNFVANMLGVIDPNYRNHVDKLYAVRCSLVHTYGASEASEKLNFTPHYLWEDAFDQHLIFNTNENKLYLVLPSLVADLIAAVEAFFREQLNDDTIVNNWQQKLYYPTGLSAWSEKFRIKEGGAIDFQSIHPALEVLNTETDQRVIVEMVKNYLQTKISQKV